MICSSLSWQKDYKSESELINVENEPEWVKAFVKAKHSTSLDTQTQKRHKRLKKSKSSLNDHHDVKDQDSDTGLDVRYLVEDYESDKETDLYNLDFKEETKETKETMQIFYASRTHSQLSQFIGEVNKTVFKNVKAVCIGSRKSTCGNDKVQKLKSLPRINDACLDLQKGKGKCKYLTEFLENKDEFVDGIHDSVKDIEELAELGKSSGKCAYYGTREAIKSSQVILDSNYIKVGCLTI